MEYGVSMHLSPWESILYSLGLYEYEQLLELVINCQAKGLVN